MNEPTMRETRLFVDAHVHFYDCFDPCTFFSSAYANLSSPTEAAIENETSVKVLLLTETPGENGFLRLLDASENIGQPICTGGESWYSHTTGEVDSVSLKTHSGKVLYVIAGRQIVSHEGLEVHALATDALFDEGRPLLELIEAINRSGGVAAVPWGTGKWLGRRGKVLTSMSRRFVQAGVLLSDSGIRPWAWPRSGLFNSGPRVIAGTDPLPISTEACRTGSFGFSTIAPWDPERPTHSMRTILKNQLLEMTRFGRPQGVWQFLSRQLAIRT
ncbi:MAG TPA: hypothetical protein ENI67_06895 [Gammaproteobacteria bacterium]|nr:hypothetical protein [Gammaproteobacteria bacterium]